MERGCFTNPRGQNSTKKIDSNRATPRYIVIKMGKKTQKDRLFKAIREKKNLKYKRKAIRINIDLP